MLNDFLFELGVEELPSASVWPLARAMTENILTLLGKAGLSFDTVETFATPRRLAVLLTGLPEEQASQKTVRRGPALAAAYDGEGLPTPALKGFAASCQVDVGDLTISKTEKGEWLVYESVKSGMATSELLPTIVIQALGNLPIAKPMRWGEGEQLFARPVHWAVMLLGSKVLPCEILGVPTGQTSYGHRFHAPGPIFIEHPTQYEALLMESYVVANFAKRRSIIVSQIENQAKQYDSKPIMPEALLDEVCSIVEWPEALVASFNVNFLNVPPEALIASMQSHQKCFALEDKHGKLLPQFIAVTNLKSQKPEQVIAGNEKVMRARLSDADFFFNQDKKQPLSHLIARTANVVFQVQLGTLLEKATRIESIISNLTGPLQLDRRQAIRAAQLSKCDLMTGMVGEFPELQGLMGYYYARQDGEAFEVAEALREQYLPRFAADELPDSALGMALSLADRLDTLVGIFAIDQKPTGDKDPFKLRRHALAVVRMLIANPAPLSLSELIENARGAFGSKFAHAGPAMIELQAFIFERLQSYYSAQGISGFLVQAVKVCQPNYLADFDKRLKALAEFVKQPEAPSLAAACKRVNNLLQHEASVDFQSLPVNEDLLQDEAEKRLFSQLVRAEQVIVPMYTKGDYVSVFTHLAGLKEPVDAFFETVMVMVEDKVIKSNRLALLSRLQALLQGPADISLLQVI